MSATAKPKRHTLAVDGLARLLHGLRADGYTLVGPTVRDGAIVQAEIATIDDLPAGFTEVQEAGTYRLVRRDDDALFGFSVGPHSYKQLFFVPRLRLVKLRRKDEGFGVEQERDAPPRLAVIGARSCDLHAIEVQDRTFLRGPYVDADYEARRSDVFVVAVHCGQAGGTCFCVSMETGPRATFGFDLALTELLEPHRFLVEIGSERGAALLARLDAGDAGESEVQAADDVVAQTARSMGRRMDTTDIKELLYRNAEHPRWDDVADRCLACTNCTLACPTCFCSSVEDVSDLGGETAERWRRWDSCFTLDHSYLHGGSVRTSIRARYRQWLTHKVASWIDQFDTSGCVGCGRCITWCPVGIDITEEVAAIRAADGARRGGPLE
jgi:ferredoxin